MSLSGVCFDCLACVVNNSQLSSTDVANVRSSTKGMRTAVDASLRSLEAAIADVQKIAILLAKLPALTHLSLGQRHGSFDGLTTYARLADYVSPLTAELSSHTNLTSLVLSTDDLLQLGSLKWAHNICSQQQRAASPSKSSSIRKWYKGDYAEYASDSQHQVYWLPNWMASPPGLQKLVLQPPFRRSSIPRCCCFPACLWFNPKAWAGKLQHLELRGLPVVHHMPPGLSQLSRLHTLSLLECCLQPEGLEGLLRQLVQGGVRLRVLLLSSNDLWQLPKDGWPGLADLQELDLSCNQLVSLPAGLSHLMSLTSLQLQHNQLETLPAQLTSLQQLAVLNVSHNWLSGFNKTSHWAQLLSSWQKLRELILCNVSDKRGALMLPSQLGVSPVLRELVIGHNHCVDWDSLEKLLDKCESIRLLDLSGVCKKSLPANLRVRLESLRHKGQVIWD